MLSVVLIATSYIVEQSILLPYTFILFILSILQFKAEALAIAAKRAPEIYNDETRNPYANIPTLNFRSTKAPRNSSVQQQRQDSV